MLQEAAPNSDAGAVSGGDSPQRATWVAQRDARRLSYHTRGRVQRDRRERENENESSECERPEWSVEKNPGSLRRDFCIQSPTRLRIQDRGVTL